MSITGYAGGQSIPEINLTLPDGSEFDCPDQFKSKMAGTLRSLMEGYQSFQQPNNSHILRMLLQLSLDEQRLDARAAEEEQRTNPDIRRVTGLRGEARKLRKELVELYTKLGIVGSGADRGDPMQYVEDLRKRATRFIEKHGLEKTYACRACGHMQMVYALMEIEYRPAWERLSALLERRGVDPEAIASVITGLQGDGIPAEWRIVHTPFSHPFLNHPTFPLWSTAIRDMLTEKCECGRSKLSLEDAARILKTSVPGVDQMDQAWRAAEGLPPIEGAEGKAADVFHDEQQADGDN